jgi:hypothetical protein
MYRETTESIREKFKLYLIVVFPIYGAAGLCRGTGLLDNGRRYVQSTIHSPVTHQQINCHS